MSRIFDALQRSESERLGRSVSTATELLEVAERQSAKAQPSGKTESNKGIAPAFLETAPAVAPPIPEKVESLFVSERPIAYEHFQTVKVAVPPDSRLVCLTDNESLAAEKFGLLSVRLQHIQRRKTLKAVLVTSSMPGEGKSMVAANLACTLARKTKKKVLLVEGDLRRPSIAQMLGLGKIPGLSECLRGQQSLMTSIHQLESWGLFILTAGSASSDPLELLQVGRLSAIWDQLKAWFDWIILDSPPLLPMADTSVLMRLADGIILVVRQGVTEKQQLERGIEALEKKNLIGAVLNSAQNTASSEYYYRYYSSPSSKAV